MQQIKYKKGYKYQLYETYSIKTDIIGYTIDNSFLKLSSIGVLTCIKGYAWDGPSGPSIDTPNWMRASLIHDALYQLMRLGLIPNSFRSYVDSLMKQVCIEDKMWKLRAECSYQVVRLAASKCASVARARKIIIAPKQ
jgi:hypothetical protein